MTGVWGMAALWLALALAATLLSIWLRVATALSEIVVGTVAQLILGAVLGGAALSTGAPWITFLAGTGAIVLTFLAGAELDPTVLRTSWRPTLVVGLVGFVAPFFGCAAAAHFLLHWSVPASWLAGIALSTTSVAVVYAVMLELGLNTTEYGKAVLAACFVNDLGTVIALGLIFSPFSVRTVVFAVVTLGALGILPWLTPRFFRRFGGRPSELETKYLLLTLFGLGALASWAGSEPVLAAYLVGMVLAGTVAKDHILIRRLRTLTFGLLTPFYFIRPPPCRKCSTYSRPPVPSVRSWWTKGACCWASCPTATFSEPSRDGGGPSRCSPAGRTWAVVTALPPPSKA